MSFLQPHTPVVVPEPYASMYVDVDWVGDDPVGPGGPSAFEVAFGELGSPDDLGADGVRAARARYYGLCCWLDAQVGRVLDALASGGQGDRTVVVFCADHGAGLGQNGNWGKHTFAPQVHRTPLIVAGPDIGVGEERADLCQLVDLAPTLLGVSGVDGDVAFDGRDLFADHEPEAIFSVIGYGEPGSPAEPLMQHGSWPDGRGWPQRVCVRDGRFRLDRNTRIDGTPIATDHPDADVALIDTDADPLETTNLAGEPAYAADLDRLSASVDDVLATAAPSALGDFYERYPEILDRIIRERFAEMDEPG